MEQYKDGIAIVGMSCRFPGASNLNEYWDNLVQNKETIHFFSDEEIKDFEYDFDRLKSQSNYVKAKGIIKDVDKWDASFFNTTPHDAEIMDPQIRLWLSNTWHAFEDAGINPFSFEGNIGVYTGSVSNYYLLNNVLRDPEKYELYIRNRTPEIFQTYLNSDPMFLATRTAYFFNLKGTALSIQTACSTSLVAVAQACNSLFAHESDVCIAGGVTVTVPQESGYLYLEGAIQSPDGHCRPFDKDSKGTVFSNGVGTVVLKRMEDAINDKDRIYGVIRGWATNNDGSEKIGYTAPAVKGQQDAISAAHSFAEINAGDICYIEAHGTATPLGDPIEVKALTEAFKETTDKTQFCGLGSVKSNIGHLDAAAGVAGLIKTALSAYNKTIPATLHYKEPNPYIDFENTPFFVANKNINWDKPSPMHMGVSSFGVGGTNAHVVLSSYQNPIEERVSKKNSSPEIFLLSAKSDGSLLKMEENFHDYLASHPQAANDEIAATLQFRRAHFPYRSYALAGDKPGTINDSFTQYHSTDTKSKTVFLYPGQGAQYINMGRDLYETEEVFRQAVDQCFTLYTKITSKDLKPILFNEEVESNTSKLAETRYTQPALFIIEYGLTQLYKHFGIVPDLSVGHSIGEYTSACISGVFDLETTLKIVIKRGELMYSAPKGSMMAVSASQQQLSLMADDLFEIAAINSPYMCTISFQDIHSSDIIKLLEVNNYKYIPLNTSHAFHSRAFEPITQEFEEFVDSLPSNSPQIPFISCLTGGYITEEQATSGKYWAAQLRNAVLFSRGIDTIANEKNLLLIEVGPNTHLRSLVYQNETLSEKDNILTSIGKPNKNSDRKEFLKSLGEIWIRGNEIDFTNLYSGDTPRHVSLPPYPFEENRYWIDFQIGNNTFDNTIDKKEETPTIEKQKDNNKKDIPIKLAELVSHLTGIKPDEIPSDKNFRDLNIESLNLARIAVEVEKKFNVKLPFRDLVAEYNTTEKLAAHIDTTVKEHVEKDIKNIDQLYCLHSNGNKPPLFNVYAEKTLIFDESHFGVDRPVYAFIWPGSDGNTSDLDSVESITKKYIDQIRKIQPRGPYYICGFSLGGLIAHEIARTLQEEGEEVPCLTMFDVKHPEYKIKTSNKWSHSYKEKGMLEFIKVKFLISLPNFLSRKINVYLVKTFLLFKLKFTLKMLNQEIRRLADKLVSEYRPPNYYKGDILIYTTDDSSFIDDKYLGWKTQENHTIKSVKLTGGHIEAVNTLLNREVVSETLREFLDKH